MRIPATHFAGNLMWTRSGHVYATWALTPLPAGKTDDDLCFIADAHTGLYRALVGKEALLRGQLVWTDPVAVVAKMVKGVDLWQHQAWAEECEATIGRLEEMPLGSRRWTLTVPLNGGSWKQRAATILRSATTDLCDQLQLPAIAPNDSEIENYRLAAETFRANLPPTFNPTPVTVAQQIWGIRESQTRGTENVTDPYDDPDLGEDLWGLRGRAAAGEPLLDPGGLTDLDGPWAKAVTGPVRRRWLKVVSDTGATSYQAGLVLADPPAGGMATPGGEFLGKIDQIGVPADIAIRLAVRSRNDALQRNKRSFTVLNDQVDQVDASDAFASLSPALQESARLLAEYNQRLTLDVREVEVETVVMLSVTGPTGEAVDDLCREFTQHPHNKDFTWARPIGAEEGVFWASQPGGPLTTQLRDYRHLMPATDFGAAAPLMSYQLGAAAGPALMLNTTTPLLSLAHIDLIGEATRNFSPSLAACGELGSGKALAVDTPIPTPHGWIDMGSLRVGDHVLDDQGRPTKIIAASPVMLGHRCIELTFSDGSTIAADAGHLWTTIPRSVRGAAAKGNWKARHGSNTLVADLDQHASDLSGPAWPNRGVTITTQQLHETLKSGNQANHAIPVAAPLDLPEIDLPIDPYVLGAWLGDGNSGSSNFTSADPELLDFVRAAGFNVTKLKSPLHYRITLPRSETRRGESRPCAFCSKLMISRYGHQRYCSQRCAADARRAGFPAAPRRVCPMCGQPLMTSSTGLRCSSCWRDSTLNGRLAKLGLLNNKHIPAQYLRSGRAQRQALLAGLLDTDGTVKPDGAVELCVTNQRLARDTRELVLTLGHRAAMREGRARLYGRDCGPKWTVSFTTTDTVFRLPRKIAALSARTTRSSATRTKFRYVVSTREVASVPVRCIQVAAESHLYLAGPSMIPTHNSFLEKAITGHEIDRGSRAISLDGSRTREWAQFARSLSCTTALVDAEEPTVSMDPLRVLPLHQAGPVLQSFLTKLCDFSATSVEGRTLAKALKLNYLQAHQIRSCQQLLAHLASGCDLPQAADIADRIHVFADPDTAGSLAEVVFSEQLPPLDMSARMIVIGTHGLQLPSTAELSTPHRYDRLPVSKVFGQAFFLLATNYAYEVCFSDPSDGALFVVDETWRVTLSEEGTAKVLEFIRDGRKVKAGVVLGSHSPKNDFGNETVAGLIGYKVAMRNRNQSLAEEAVRWLGFDPDTRPDLVEHVQLLSPQNEHGVVPPERRGECVMVDARNRFGNAKVLPPARTARAAALDSTPPTQKATL